MPDSTVVRNRIKTLVQWIDQFKQVAQFECSLQTIQPALNPYRINNPVADNGIDHDFVYAAQVFHESLHPSECAD